MFFAEESTPLEMVQARYVTQFCANGTDWTKRDHVRQLGPTGTKTIHISISDSDISDQTVQLIFSVLKVSNISANLSKVLTIHKQSYKILTSSF